MWRALVSSTWFPSRPSPSPGVWAGSDSRRRSVVDPAPSLRTPPRLLAPLTLSLSLSLPLALVPAPTRPPCRSPRLRRPLRRRGVPQPVLACFSPLALLLPLFPAWCFFGSFRLFFFLRHGRGGLPPPLISSPPPSFFAASPPPPLPGDGGDGYLSIHHPWTSTTSPLGPFPPPLGRLLLAPRSRARASVRARQQKQVSRGGSRGGCLAAKGRAPTCHNAPPLWQMQGGVGRRSLTTGQVASPPESEAC